MELGGILAAIIGLMIAIIRRKRILRHERDAVITLGTRLKRVGFCCAGTVGGFWVLVTLAQRNSNIHPITIVPLLLLVAAFWYQSFAAIWVFMKKMSS